MNPELREKVNGMLELYEKISGDFRWENSLHRHLAALTYTTKNKSYNADKVKSLIAYIKEKTGIFSNFRSHSFVLSTLICSEYDDPKYVFDRILRNEETLKGAGFKSSMYLPIAAYSLLLTCEETESYVRARRAYDIYKQIKKLHPWLTSGDDYALCVLLASSSEASSVLVEKTETCYKELRERGFLSSNALQFLSHILSFSSEPVEIKAERCRRIYEALNEKHLKIYSNYYAALGLLTLTQRNIEDGVEEVVELVNYLKKLKSYRWLGKGMNVLIASSLIASSYTEEMENNGRVVDTALSISIDTLIAAQQAASIAAMSASVAAASSSSGS